MEPIDECPFCGEKIYESSNGLWLHPDGKAYMGDCRLKYEVLTPY